MLVLQLTYSTPHIWNWFEWNCVVLCIFWKKIHAALFEVIQAEGGGLVKKCAFGSDIFFFHILISFKHQLFLECCCSFSAKNDLKSRIASVVTYSRELAPWIPIETRFVNQKERSNQSHHHSPKKYNSKQFQAGGALEYTPHFCIMTWPHKISREVLLTS